MDPALESIERSLLPGAVLLLDGLLDSAALALPGVDCAPHAAELRRLAGRLAALSGSVAALVPPQEAERPRMSA